MYPSPQTPPRTLYLLATIFFICGLSLIPHIGIQTDEAIFTNVLFDNAVPFYTISVFKYQVPLMIMTYLGTTKSALYDLLWRVFDPTVYSLRVPPLLLGVATLFLFYSLVRRMTHPRVALLAAAFLSTDTTYLATTTLDWGPVAIQHFTLLLGLLLLVKSYQTGQFASLAGGAFWLGIGFWDKALFIWMMSAATVAAVLIIPRELRRFLSLRRIIALGFFFIVGALPLIIYNIRQPLATFRSNTTFVPQEIPAKLPVLRATADGSAVFGYLVAEDWATRPRSPSNAWERAVLTVQRLAGERRDHLHYYALLVALAFAPVLFFTPYQRPYFFTLLMLAIGWGQMLVGHNTGGGAHHTILLWPFPHLLTALAVHWVGEKSGRFSLPVTGCIAGVLCLSGFLTTNHLVAQAIRNGGPGAWTNAHFNLSARLSSYQAERIYLADWGMLDNTRLLHRGRLPLHIGSDPLMTDRPTPADKANLATMLAIPNTIWLSNTDDRQAFTDVNPRLLRLASELGYQRQLLETVYDYNGHPCFEISRFMKKP